MATWQSLHYLNLLWLLFPVAALFVFAHKRRQAILKKAADTAQTAAWTKSVNTSARIFKCLLLLLAMAAIIVALARPVWNKKEQPFKAQGRDVVFVLDISRSMLAAHRNTTRLEEAKFAIQECLSTVRGDRVALVIFAGNAKVACPLTHDYAYFRAKLGDVDYRSVTFGGTMLGDAVRLACTGLFKTKAQLYRDVIVITDGEDMQSNPIQAAEQLAEYNARLIAVGMGDPTPRPLVITLPDGSQENIQDNGTQVMTRLDADTLLKMTEATPGGVFIPVPSDTTLNLNEIYKKFIELQLKQDFETHSVVTYEEKFQLFLAMALVLLVVARLLPDRRKAVAMLCATAALALQGATPGSQAANLVNQAKAQIEAGQLDDAQATLKSALELQADNPVAQFDMAAISYLKENFQESMNGFQRALELAQKQKLDYPAFEEKARLGLAAAAYRFSQQQDNQEPLDAARKAVENYRMALACNKTSLSTKANLDKAKTNYKEILRKTRQQPRQSGNDGKKDGKEAKDDKQQDDKKQQSQQQDALKQLEQQQRQAEQDMADGRKSPQDLQKQQQQLEQQAQQALDKQRQMDAQNKQDGQSQAQDMLRQSQAKQQEAADELKKDNVENARKAQKEAADFTQMARHALNNDANGKPQQPENGQPAQQQPQQEQQGQQQPQQEQQGQQQPQPLNDARAMDAINQENINRLNRQRHSFTAPSAQNKDW